MDNNMEEQAERGTRAPDQEELPSTTEARAAMGELSLAVGKYALMESQVDVKIASQLVKISNELESLGARVEKLEREFGSPRKRATHNSSRSDAHA